MVCWVCVSGYESGLYVGWWVIRSQSVPVVLGQVGVGSIWLERVVLRGDRIVLDDMVVVREGGAGGHLGNGAGDGLTSCVSNGRGSLFVESTRSCRPEGSVRTQLTKRG